MKTKITFVCALLLFSICLVACKHKNVVKPTPPIVGNPDVQLPDYTVIPLAGGTSPGSLQDGAGTLAHYNYPRGLQVKPGGIIYVADYLNNAIRKVVLTPLNGDKAQYSATTTTLSTPGDSSGLKLTFPLNVGVADDGTINTQFQSPDTASHIIHSRMYKPNGVVHSMQTDHLNNYGISKDPTQAYFWFAGYRGLGKFWLDHIQNPNHNLPLDTLDLFKPDGSLYKDYAINTVYACPNGNIYIATPVQVFKIGPSGSFNKIGPVATYNNLPFKNITDITVTDDGKTIYIADSGAIRKLVGTTVTTITYPTGGSFSEGTAVSSYVRGLALDNANHILYFTDNSGVKLLVLPGYVSH